MTEPKKILIVEDDAPMRETCLKILQKEGYAAAACASGADAINAIKKENTYGIVLTDLMMEGMDGIELLKQIKAFNKNIEVIIMTGFGSIKNVVEAMKFGAANYITKPFNKDELLIVIKNILKMNELQGEIVRLRSELGQKYGMDNIIGRSPGIKTVCEKIEVAAKSDSNVLICGESGTGKELVARAIHYHSLRAQKPFVPIDSPAIPKDLFESELFGHVKGAFTGAVADSIGLFKFAEGGTLFLDEISEIPQNVQAKLLRSLQDKNIRPVGGTKEMPIDVRIVAATKRNAQEIVSKGFLRDDLFYRLNVIQITIPPLRERKEDILLLTEHFLETQSQKNNNRIEKVTPEAMQALLNYDWPGNVRELENVIEQSFIIAKNGEITVQNLPAYIFNPAGSAKNPVLLNLTEYENIDLAMILQTVEKTAIEWALAKANGNQTLAAGILGLSKSTFRDKMLKFAPDETTGLHRTAQITTKEEEGKMNTGSE